MPANTSSSIFRFKQAKRERQGPPGAGLERRLGLHLLDGDAGLPALLVEDAEADLTTWVDAATKRTPYSRHVLGIAMQLVLKKNCAGPAPPDSLREFLWLGVSFRGHLVLRHRHFRAGSYNSNASLHSGNCIEACVLAALCLCHKASSCPPSPRALKPHLGWKKLAGRWHSGAFAG